MADIPSLWDRKNLAKWAVPTCKMPAVTAALLGTPSLTYDPYDRSFRGQVQRTTYFDTDDFDLRQARKHGDRYLVLRLRCYEGSDGEFYALSAKTESQKFRVEVDPEHAEAVVSGALPVEVMAQVYLPADLLARLLSLAGGESLAPVVAVCYRRYAVQDDAARLTLDTEVNTDAGKCLHYGVLEYKSVDPDSPVPGALQGLGLRPLKLSKFLWATRP